MAVDQSKVIDLIGVDIATGEVILTISDHLDWKDGQEHLLALQEKLNTYLAFVESGELVASYPDAKERAVVIKVLFKFRPDEMGLQFLAGVKEAIRSAGLSFRHEVFAESYNN